MKRRIIIFKFAILLIGLTFILSGCGQEPDKVKVGTYAASEGLAYLEIQEDNAFILNRGAGTDYEPRGNYTIYNNLLILHVEGELGEDVINFQISGDTLIFESGELAEGIIEKGREFVYSGEDLNDKLDEDIDEDSGNRIKEGVYLAKEGFAFLRLEKDKTFILQRTFNAKDEPTGNYIIDGDTLILKVDDEAEDHGTQFKINGHTLILDSGRLAQGHIKNGTEFLYREEDLSLEELEEEYLQGNDHRFIEGIEFGIFDDGKDLAKKWGDPLYADYLDGGLYMQYEDVVFHTDGHIDKDGNYIFGIINAIDSKESYGVKQGMTIEESREILGEPDARGIYDELKEYGHGIVGPADFYYKGDFTMKIPYNHEKNFVYRVHLGRFRDEPDIIGSGFLELSDWETSKYEDYILDFNDNKLLDSTPMNIMKMFLHALKEKNYEAEWELYTKREDHPGWDKEYHMENLGEDNTYDFNIFSNAENIRVDYVNDDQYVVISWEDRNLEEYDSLGKPFRYNFSMVRDSDEYGNKIWKVGFKPMEY